MVFTLLMIAGCSCNKKPENKVEASVTAGDTLVLNGLKNKLAGLEKAKENQLVL